MNLVDLSGKHLLITGASSGIGRSTSILCSNLGANIIITSRNKFRLNETLISLGGEGHNALCCDLTQSEEVNEMVDGLPQLDGVVFCACIK